jgi:subfamily B ATP-binding cassette protein MsbA
MRRLWRLLNYVRPYAFYSLASVVLMAVVGAMAGMRVLLIKPIIDNVLSPMESPNHVLLFTIPHTRRTIDLQVFIPHHFHNAWTVVAVALVGSAVIKSICDYLGTLLANKAGYGMITDLRNDFYDSILRRSTAFFQRHPSGTLISTLINDVERVQNAMASILSDFLQQFFTLIVMTAVVVIAGGTMALVLLLFVPVVIFSSRRVGRSVRTTTRSGQDKLAEIQNIVQETITGNGIVKAFGMEHWEMNRFRRASDRLLSANMRSVAVQAISSPLMDALGAVLMALLLWYGRTIILHGVSAGTFITFLCAVIVMYDPVRRMPVFYNSFQQAVGASEHIFRFMDADDDVREKRRATVLRGFRESVRFEQVDFAYECDGEMKQVLHAIDLDVKRGEVIAIVGPSGAGNSALLRCDRRMYHDRWARPARRDHCQPAQADRQGDTGDDPFQRHGAQQHCVWPARRAAGPRPGGGAHGAGARLYPAHAGWLRHHDRREGDASLGRRTAEAGGCARHPEECADPDSG